MSNDNLNTGTVYGGIACGFDHMAFRTSADTENKANTPKEYNVRCTNCDTVMRSTQEGDFCANLVCNMHGKIQQRLFTE